MASDPPTKLAVIEPVLIAPAATEPTEAATTFALATPMVIEPSIEAVFNAPCSTPMVEPVVLLASAVKSVRPEDVDTAEVANAPVSVRLTVLSLIAPAATEETSPKFWVTSLVVPEMDIVDELIAFVIVRVDPAASEAAASTVPSVRVSVIELVVPAVAPMMPPVIVTEPSIAAVLTAPEKMLAFVLARTSSARPSKLAATCADAGIAAKVAIAAATKESFMFIVLSIVSDRVTVVPVPAFRVTARLLTPQSGSIMGGCNSGAAQLQQLRGRAWMGAPADQAVFRVPSSTPPCFRGRCSR